MARHTKKHKKVRRSKRHSRGGGWTDGPGYVAAGYLEHNQYDGPGKDCAGTPTRPGYIPYYSGKGLPGLSGGKRNVRHRKVGGTQLSIADPLVVAGSVTDKPDSFPNPSGSGGTVEQPNPNGNEVIASWPGNPVPNNSVVPKGQSGGRYGFFPQMGPLNPSNGVGVSPAPFGRIPCESGTLNPLNPNPGNIQGLSTAPLQPPYVTMRGGSSIPAGSGLAASAANFPVVRVGAADSMAYYAPTAGYRNDFQTFPGGSPTPGYTIQTPYDARAFNRACVTTGGRRKSKKGGALPVAHQAESFIPIRLNQVETRKDFDGSDKGLPVKFGGSRRSHPRRSAHTKKHRRRPHHSKKRRHN